MEIGAGAIQRLLNGQHLGIRRRLFQQLHHALETFVRMMQQHVLITNDFEDVRAFRNTGAGAGTMGVAQFRRMIPL